MDSSRKNGVEYIPNNLIVNYLPQSMTQEDVRSFFGRIGEVKNCKLVRDHSNGISLGYGFVEYSNNTEAQRAISELDGINVQGKTIRVSYARPSSSEIKNANLYITGLPVTVDEKRLGELFNSFGVIITQKVLYNNDGTSQGVGFVRFNKRSECDQAIAIMSGKVVDGGTVPLTIKYAIQPAAKHQNAGAANSGTEHISTLTPMRGQFRYNPMMARTPALAGAAAGLPAPTQSPFGAPQAAAKSQTPWCLYVANLQPAANDLDLYKVFSPFGAIISVKTICDISKPERPCKGYGFVNFQKYEDAYGAVFAVNNMMYEGKSLQVSFKAAKGQANLPPRPIETRPPPVAAPPLGYEALMGLEKRYIPF